MKALPEAKTRAGWTLSELLLVITIVAVLVVLLLPAMRAVRLYGTQVKCAGNMRAYGTALLAYIGDHGGLPDRRDPASAAIGYTGLIIPRYLNVNKSLRGRYVLHCPLAKERDQRADFGVEYGGNFSLSRWYPKLNNIPAPANRVVLAAETYYTYFYDYVHLNAAIWGAGADESSKRDQQAAVEGRRWTPQYHGRGKSRGLHFFFLDGHVELVHSSNNHWADKPTYGDATNGGYFYDQRQFHQMAAGNLVVE